MEGKDAKRQGRYTQFAMAATKLALEDAKLDAEALEKVDKDKFGVLIGSGIGGVEFFENNCQKFNDAGAGAKGLKKVGSLLLGGGLVACESANYSTVDTPADSTSPEREGTNHTRRGP